MRFGIVAVLIVLRLFVYVPRLFPADSISAVVRGRTIRIVASIPGEITKDLPVFGHELAKDEVIAGITNNTVDKTKLQQLSIDQKYYQERISASY